MSAVLPSLHDATLVAIEFRWGSGEIHMSFIGGPSLPGKHLLVFRCVTSFSAPRSEPWGPSSSIMELKQPTEGEWELHMQSGDTLLVGAHSAQLTAAKAS